MSLLALGGMGEIWQAEDLLLGRDVAVKVLRPHLADPSAADRLRAEARAAAMLSSQRVVKVHDSGEFTDSEGRSAPFLVMELVPGRSLAQLLTEDPQLSPERTAVVVRHVAEALAEAHDLGLVHRDIKPANVLLLEDGNCKVTDFGISSHSDSAALTATGLVMGTARYLSPEQVNGLRATSASDIYALGVMTHEALRGQRLYDADSEIANALAHVQRNPAALPTSVPPALAALVTAMLAKDPSDRPDARGVMAALDAGAPVVAPATAVLHRTVPLVIPTQATPSRIRRWVALSGVTAVAGLVFAMSAAGKAKGTDAAPPSVKPSPVTKVQPADVGHTPARTVVPAANKPRIVRAPNRVVPVVKEVPPRSKHGHGDSGDDHGDNNQQD